MGVEAHTRQPATFFPFNIGWDLVELNLTVTRRTSS